MFLELSGQRTGSGFGPNPLQFSEIMAWQQLRGRRLRLWEFRALLLMDRGFIAECNEASKPEKEQVSDEPLSPAVFDRIFGSG